MSDYNNDYLNEDDVSQEEPIITYPISCTNVPDSLFDDDGIAAREHFEKFGVITKILLRPSKKSCVIEFERRDSAERAILNAGAYDGFMFDVTWSKDRKRPKAYDEDPEWLPDPEVEAELKAMLQKDDVRPPRIPRQKKMEIDKPQMTTPPKPLAARAGILRKKTRPVTKPVKRSDSPVIPPTPQQPLDKEEIRLLLTRTWPTPSDKLKALEIRDKIIRLRLPVRKGAIQGCCPDMCSERERLLRDTQKQITSYEYDDTGNLDPHKAVKQYSRSSADQEEPLAHELRPIPTLQDTLLYLLHHIVDTCQEDTSLEDWFHFLWDRLRAIRKDITQQNLTCEGSVALVEACARFHAHCSARLVEEPPSSFDQRLNTENLLKCLQTLKYMYQDLRAKAQQQACSREAEFRAYVILLNMNDANFMWEVQRLDPTVLDSPEVKFAIRVFTALDNNHYVQFFKLVRETTYLNACILLRYFNNVRARALHRIMKTYSPRGTSHFPAQDLMDMLGFESLASMELFLENYGLQVVSDQHSSYVILNKNTFHDNDTPAVQERAVNLVESKLDTSLGEVIYGGPLPESKFYDYIPHSSFDSQGFFKKSAILAQDQGYVPKKETLDEIMNVVSNLSSIKKPVEVKPFESNVPVEKKPSFVFTKPDIPKELPQNSFKIPASSLFKKSQDSEREDAKALFKKSSGFVFSEPAQPVSAANIFSEGLNKVNPPSNATNIFKIPAAKTNVFDSAAPSNPFGGSTTFTSSTGTSIFGSKPSVSAADLFKTSLANTAANNNAFVSPSSLFGSAVAQQEKEKEDGERKKADEEMRKRKEEEMRRRQEEEVRRKKEEEDRKIQEKIKEEMRKQEELRLKIEEEKRILEDARRKIEEEKRAEEMAKQKAEMERKERERKRKEFEIKVEKQLQSVVPEIINEVVDEQCTKLAKESLDWFQDLHERADKLAEDLIMEMCKSECLVGVKTAMRLREIRTRIICRSTIKTWRNHVGRSRLRRLLLHTTPTWLPMRPPPKAVPLQTQMLQKMRDFHQRKLPVLMVPEPRYQETINLYKTVKRTLFQRSQENDKNRKSSAIYWKTVVSTPDFNESDKAAKFFSNWIKELFCDEQVKSKPKHVLYFSKNLKFSLFCISVCHLQGDSTQQSYFNDKINGWNGLVFYGDTQNIQKLTKRIENTISSKCPYEMLPIAIVVVENSKGNAITALENTLQLYKESRSINHYKIFRVQQLDESLLCNSTKAAFNWLAKYLPSTPCIKADQLPSFLDICLGSELCYRFNLALKSSVRKAFESIETMTNLFNEAIEKTIDIACNKSLLNYPTFGGEFKDFIVINDVYPKDYQYISPIWMNNLIGIEKVLNSFKIKLHYKDSWPPTSLESFRDSLTVYVKNLNWFDDYESVVLKILSTIKDEYDLTNGSFMWIDVLNVLTKEKIKETVLKLEQKCAADYKKDEFSNELLVIYQNDDLSSYRSTPWWYLSRFTQAICPELIELPEDDSDLEIDHYISCKKIKLDDSLDSSHILDDKWLNNVLLDIDTSMTERENCNAMLSELDKTIEAERQKQQEFMKMLQSAIDEG